MENNSFEIMTIVYVIVMTCFNLLYSYSFNKLNDRVKFLEEKMSLLIKVTSKEVEEIKNLNSNHNYLVSVFEQIDSAEVKFRFNENNLTEKKTLN